MTYFQRTIKGPGLPQPIEINGKSWRLKAVSEPHGERSQILQTRLHRTLVCCLMALPIVRGSDLSSLST